ncbi:MULTISPECIES: PAS domain-containing sensor histidine kinase [unclassified Burkholderia]|uniref:PAS domain-containing sensor histidine kinase n=1 Tax=unclassified Burkholderia TaxID=2613784 RepID=UPI0014233D97|nr:MULTISPECIES: PAS domain-containing sensor histidine kinase [unclassified Burkholderia]NIE82377.1 PAS domain S-box protein [Burkholderia sp. Tr-860]NIF61268.1 PAS domain S-box protein [Burkholderia sp. Cy-647]NIF96185.1 PAS domain S-box protein [Burkholderia sp. Ax-1720]
MDKHEQDPRKARDDAEQFRFLVQGVTDYAIFTLSPAGIVTSWNMGAQRIKGYTREEILGRHFSCFYTPEDRAGRLPESILATAAREGRAEREGWRLRKDGSRFWAHVVVDAIRDEHGELAGFAKVTRDNTERRQIAAELERANAALFQAQKMEAIGRLTGGIAHDFNNLLAILSGSTHVLATQSREHVDMRLIDGMRRAIDRGVTLTQQLLSFARQQPLKPEVHDLGTLVRRFEPMLARVRAGQPAQFRLALPPEPLAALVDAPRFEAALLNLVVNAVDAMPEGGTVKISAALVETDVPLTTVLDAGRYARISISDTGIGMSPGTLAQAFEPFFTTKPAGQGTGLGLSQVYGFITQSGGDVVIHSTEGAGTTIELFLPAVEPAEAAPRAVGSDVETVLLVEDETDLLDVAVELFRSIGYEVVAAASADEAAAILARRDDIDVLFTDITMPHGMNGAELAKLARDRHPGLKVILTSGYPLAALRQEYGALGEFTFLYKPYRLADLAKALRT